MSPPAIFANPLRSSGSMRIAVPKETASRDLRVTLVPESRKKLKQAGYDIAIQAGARAAAGYPAAEYAAVGADVEANRASLVASGDIVLKVNAPTDDEIAAMRPGTLYL